MQGSIYLLFYFLDLYFSDNALQSERSEGFRVERVGIHGVKINFTWIRLNNVRGHSQASQMCSNMNGLLPKASEMRYFYKTLRSDDIKLPDTGEEFPNRTGVVFYLADILEATMDYPNTESGERFCLVVEKRSNSMLRLAETLAPKSCLTAVNLLVCKIKMVDNDQLSGDYQKNSRICNSMDGFSALPKWINELKQKAEIRDSHICTGRILFILLTVFAGITMLSMMIAIILLAYKNRELRRFGIRRAYASSDDAIWPLETTHSFNRPAGRLDILADSAFYRAPLKGSYRESIVNSGYQRVSNGRLRLSHGSHFDGPVTLEH